MDKKTMNAFTMQEERRLKERQEREEFQARCDHKWEKKGRIQSTLKATKTGELKCAVCGAMVNFEPKGKQEIADAVNTITALLHQTKAVLDINEGILEQIGFVGMFLNRVEDLYVPVREKLSERVDGGRRHNNNNNSNDYEFEDYGNYARNNRPVTLGDYKRANKGNDSKKGKDKDKDKDKKKKHKKDSYNRY